jgi:hypothetical protein
MTRFALLTAVLCTAVAIADDKKPAAAPDMAAMMEAWTKYATPGDHHKKLDGMVGDWTYTAQFWMVPGAPPMEMKGEQKAAWVMGGRYVRAHVTGPAQGDMPAFEGVSVTGYDNAKKKYVAAWVDNMGTGITHMTGEATADGKTITFHYTEFDPSTGKDAKAKQVIHWTGPDSYDQTFYKVEGGKETKTGEIKATRKK